METTAHKTLREYMEEMPKTDAIALVLREKDENNIFLFEFMREYKGELPYFDMVLSSVPTSDIGLFISNGIDYSVLDDVIRDVYQGLVDSGYTGEEDDDEEEDE